MERVPSEAPEVVVGVQEGDAEAGGGEPRGEVEQAVDVALHGEREHQHMRWRRHACPDCPCRAKDSGVRHLRAASGSSRHHH
jgi:hypothetical protein